MNVSCDLPGVVQGDSASFGSGLESSGKVYCLIARAPVEISRGLYGELGMSSSTYLKFGPVFYSIKWLIRMLVTLTSMLRPSASLR